MSITADTADRTLLIIALLGVGICFALLARRVPRVGVLLWFISVCFVPYWAGVGIGPYWPPTTVIGLLLIFSAAKIRAPRLTSWDFAVFAFGTIAYVAYAIDVVTLSEMFVVLAVWIVPFVGGRVVASRVSITWIYGTVAIAFTIVAVLAVIEFLTGQNLFASIRISNPAYESWAPLQYRGGSLRAEGAFGHSIALGASIALAVPLVMAAPFRVWIRTVMVLLMLAAVVVTFSRVGMICAVLALVLSILFLREEVPRKLRVALVVSGGIVAVGAYSLVVGVFTAAGSEATASASYRGDLTSLISQFNLLGLTGVYQKNAQGEVFFGDFHSIDSALILAGLTYGVIALAIIVVVLIGASIAVLRRRATPATIAIVAQIPAFATVALITQYAAFVWFIGGLAVSTQLMLPRMRAAAATAAASDSPGLVSRRHKVPSIAPGTLARRVSTTSTRSSPRGTNNGTS
ncbi:MAG: hypothetical protein QOF79_2973 [Actinomycetota bacterium]|nr:hypothetical protein [Actinomycetota bacterium]